VRSFTAGLGRDGREEDVEKGVEDILASACLRVSGFSGVTDKANRSSSEDRRQTGSHPRTEGMPSSFVGDYPGDLGMKPLPNLRLGGSPWGGVTIPQQGVPSALLVWPSALWKSPRLGTKFPDCPSPVASCFELQGRRSHS
jgi:hypothetical protein